MFKANEFMTMSVASTKRGVRSRPAHGGAERPPAAARAMSGVVTVGPGVTPPPPPAPPGIGSAPAVHATSLGGNFWALDGGRLS